MRKQKKLLIIALIVIPAILLFSFLGLHLMAQVPKGYNFDDASFDDAVSFLLSNKNHLKDYNPNLSTQRIFDWKGQGANPYYSTISSKYTNDGRPLTLAEDNLATSYIRFIPVSSSEALTAAINMAEPGDRIELQPGKYRFDNNITVAAPSAFHNPIIVYARYLGDTLLEFNAEEGFKVIAPFWTFQNLIIKGVCLSAGDCEHAFHVAGDADGTIIRNNILYDFNAAIKSNGLPIAGINQYPDNLLIEKNTITNLSPRYTQKPVTPIDVVGGNNVVVRANFIGDFILAYGNKVSYGAFLKGYSKNGLFEDNLIVCNHRFQLKETTQVGLSLGGGGTGAQFCFDKLCKYEHSQGTIQNNTILNCNDVGIYVNKGNQTRIKNNLLINTAGIDVRFPETTAIVENNIFDGQIRARNKATLDESGNRNIVKSQTRTLSAELCNPDAGIRSETIGSGISCEQLLGNQLLALDLKFVE